MPQQTLDYQTPSSNGSRGLQRTRLFAFGVTAAIVAVNLLLVQAATSGGAWRALWIMAVAGPATNGILALISLAGTPLVKRALLGESVCTHVLVSSVVPIGAVVCDGVAILSMGLNGR